MPKTKCTGNPENGQPYPSLEIAKAHCDGKPGCWAVHDHQSDGFMTKKFYLCPATSTKAVSTGFGVGVHSSTIYFAGKYF